MQHTNEIGNHLVPDSPWGPPWLVWALGEIGTSEIAGPQSNPRIEWYHSHTAAGPAPEDVSWCSSFVNTAMQETGFPGTRSKMASSWLAYGVRSQLRLGAIMVFGKTDPDAKGTGHVAFCAGWSKDWVLACGGNQSNQVSVVRRAVSTIVGVRIAPEYLSAYVDPLKTR